MGCKASQCNKRYDDFISQKKLFYNQWNKFQNKIFKHELFWMKKFECELFYYKINVLNMCLLCHVFLENASWICKM